MTAEPIIMLIICAGLLVYLVVRHVAAGEILMTANGWLQIFFLLLVVLLITKPLGGFHGAGF